MDFHHQTITITFGDRAENHVGMQKIGKAVDIGFSIQDIEKAKNNFELMGCKCEIIELNSYLPENIITEKAQLLIIKNGVDKLLADVHGNKDNLFDEQYFYKIKKDRYKNYFIYIYNKDYYKTLNLPICNIYFIY